jgi:hypothetical protein
VFELASTAVDPEHTSAAINMLLCCARAACSSEQAGAAYGAVYRARNRYNGEFSGNFSAVETR